MSNLALDLTDGKDPNPFRDQFGKARNLLWPVSVHRITIPVVGHGYRELNAFEILILRLLEECGPLTSEQLAVETSLPIGLIKGITDKLCDKRRIDQYNEVIQSEVSTSYGNRSQGFEFTAAVIFQDKVSGDIFPEIKFMGKSSGLKQREVTNFFRINRKHENRNIEQPTPSFIRSLAANLNRNSLDQEKRIVIRNDTEIQIVGTPETYWLNCPIAYESNSANYRIACPFGNKYSVHLEKQYRELHQKDKDLSDRHTKWENSLLSEKKSSTDGNIHDTFRTDSNWQDYPDLKMALQTNHLSPWAIYNALEWALFYSCVENNYKTQLRKIKHFNTTERQIGLFKEAAIKLGFETPNGFFRGITPSRLQSFENGKAEMLTVLPLSILVAQNHADKGLAKLAIQHPDYLRKIHDLKPSRDSIRHGSTKDSKSPVAHEKMFLESIATLVTGIHLANTKPSKEESDIATDLLLRARMAIQRELGMETYNKLTEDQQDQYTIIEKNRANPEQYSSENNKDNLIEAGHFLNGVSALFQSILKSKIMDIKHPTIPENDPTQEAQDRSDQHNLGKVPPGVPLHRIKNTLMNISDDTLNSCIICFIITAREETLGSLSVTQPGIFDLLRKLTKKVEHGNKSHPLTTRELNFIAQESYRAIKNLVEA